MASERRAVREAQFHDATFSVNSRQSVSKYYIAARSAKALYRDIIARDCGCKQVLEYGCGTGSEAFGLAERGAMVTGIDLSTTGIGKAKQLSKERKLEKRAEFIAMNAEQLGFQDNHFDIVCGSGILHHLYLGQALNEIRKMMLIK